MKSGDAPQAAPPVPSTERNILPGVARASPRAHQVDDAPSASDPIAAIVVTYRTGPILKACLERLAIACGIAEIIIVDNGNPAEDEAWIDEFARRTSGVQVLRGAGNVGFGAACNRGVAVARSPWLLFVNPDLVIEPEAPARLCSFAAERGGFTLVGGRLIGPDGREQRGCRREEITPWSALVAGLGLAPLECFSPIFRDPHRERDPVPPGAIQVAAISGALFLVSKTNFELVEGFDTNYFLHVDDIDLCRRVRDAGGSVWFLPTAFGTHVGGTSGETAYVVERWKARGFRKYFRRTAPQLYNLILGEIVVQGIALRGAFSAIV